MEFVQVMEEEDDEPIEIPTEEDKTLLLSTLQAQYPGLCGLKYRVDGAKVVRGVRSNEGRFFPPSESGWGQKIYICVFPKENKRKCDDSLENSIAKTKRIETRLRCTDLIILGLPWKTTEENLREYFSSFGEVLVAQVKKDVRSGQSKGFGFIRFSSYDAQIRVLSTKHNIEGRWCEVKVPNSKGAVYQVPCKVFVGRCTEDLTSEDLKEYFSKFGEVTDVFVPRPFRAFSFVTFLDPEVAQSLCGEDHIIKGVSVHVSNAAPKSEQIHTKKYNNHANAAGSGHSRANYTNSENTTSSYHQNGNHSHGGSLSSSHYGSSSFNSSMYGRRQDEHSRHNNDHRYGEHRHNEHRHSENRHGEHRRNTSNNYGNHRGNAQQHHHNNNNSNSNHSSSWSNQNRCPLDMPNLQALGINSQTPSSNQSQNSNNPLGLGLNSNSVPLNPAMVAATLSQWSLLGNQIQNQPSEQTNGNFLTWMAHNSSNSNGGSSSNNSNTKSALSSITNANSSANEGSNSGNRCWARQNNSAGPLEKSNFL